jgi:uncharacterized protein (UPF0332 family)
MNPREFAALASDLVSADTPTPAELRTAVSRAYYATFLVATALVKKFGVQIPKGWEGHKLLTLALRYCKDAELTNACQEIDDLRAVRWAADYDMQDDVVEDQRLARKWCARAKQAIKKLDQCEADATRLTESRTKLRNWVNTAEGASKGFTLT